MALKVDGQREGRGGRERSGAGEGDLGVGVRQGMVGVKGPGKFFLKWGD